MRKFDKDIWDEPRLADFTIFDLIQIIFFKTFRRKGRGGEGDEGRGGVEVTVIFRVGWGKLLPYKD